MRVWKMSYIVCVLDSRCCLIMVTTRHLCPICWLLVMFFFPDDMSFHPVFLNLELSVYWRNISEMETELGCLPVSFVLGELYSDNARTGLLPSQWYGGWSTEILQFFSTMTTLSGRNLFGICGLVACEHFFRDCGVKGATRSWRSQSFWDVWSRANIPPLSG